MLRVFTTYYQDSNCDRQREYNTAIQKNLDNPLIDEIIILHESKHTLPFDSLKIKSKIIESRPSFQQFFDVINEKTDEQDINIVCNTDIYFNDSLEKLNSIKTNEVYTLNRWDVLDSDYISLFPKYSTGDTWIFRGKIEVLNLDYLLGQLGCDNKLLFDLKEAGYKILNPSLTILSFHLHASNVRGEFSDPAKNYRIPAPYVYSIPEFYSRQDRWKKFFNKGPLFLFKLLLVRRSIRFQYYYDRKKGLIGHEHILIDSVKFAPWKYWLFHDFKLAVLKLNRFRI